MDKKGEYIAPSKPERDRLIADRKNDPPYPSPKPSPSGHVVDPAEKLRYYAKQARIEQREGRIRHIDEKLHEAKGQGPQAFEKAQLKGHTPKAFEKANVKDTARAAFDGARSDDRER